MVFSQDRTFGWSRREKYSLAKVLLNGHVGRPFEAVLSPGIHLLDIVVLIVTSWDDWLGKFNETDVKRLGKMEVEGGFDSVSTRVEGIRG